MLSMRTLRVALVAIGSALLLGSSLATATIQQLDGKNQPILEYAYELIGESEVQTGRVPSRTYPISSRSGHAHKLAVSVGRLIEEDDSTYVRLSLGGGMKFGKAASGLAGTGGADGDSKWKFGLDASEPPAGMCDHDNDPDTPEVSRNAGLPGTAIQTVHSSGGSVGDDYVVFRLDEGDTDSDDVLIPLNSPGYDHDDGASETPQPGCDVASGRTLLWVDITDHLAVPADVGSYTARISLHTDADEAQAGTNPSSAVAGMATIVRAVAGRDVEIRAERLPAVAHVGSTPKPFLWFDNGTSAGTSSAVLGVAKATIGRNDLLDPNGGGPAGPDDLIEPGSLTFTVEGDLSIGAFNMLDTSSASKANACVDAGKATDEKPVMGNVVPTEDNPGKGILTNPDGTTGKGAGEYYLCVQVNTQGPNADPIPATSYDATITEGFGGTRARDIASGIIGQIRRNGTTVKLTYLTVSRKYNQRLIIVNDGANDASYEVGPFVTEDGTTARAKAMASGTVSARTQVVLRMEDLVEFDGPQARASATLSMDADVDDVQVATTQVNLEDGSTDTVVYAVEGGVGVN